MSLWLLWPSQLYDVPLLTARSVMLSLVQVRTSVSGLLVIDAVGAVLFSLMLTLASLVQPLALFVAVNV